MLQKLLARASSGRRMPEVEQDREMMATRGNLVGTEQPWAAPGTELLGKLDKTTWEPSTFDALPPWVRPYSHISQWL